MSGKPPALVWWLVWLAVLGAFLATCAVLVATLTPVASGLLLGFVAVVPLAAAAFVRFVLLPAAPSDRMRFVLFVVGLALSEAAGLIAMVLGGPPRDYLAAAAIVLIVLHAPPLVLPRAG